VARHPEWVLNGKILGAFFSGGVAFALAAGESGLWTPEESVSLALLATTAATSVTSSISAAVAEFRRQRASALTEQARRVLVPLAFVLQDITGIDVRDLGTSAYLRQRPWWCPWRERLIRLYRERPRLGSTSEIRWRPGVGILGISVELGQDVCMDLRVLDEILAGVTEEEWRLLSRDVTLGLSYRDYQRVRGRYGVVLATPILQESGAETTVVGCVVVEGPPGSYDLLTSDQVRAQAGSAALILASHMG
jgi:hypothetical protein